MKSYNDTYLEESVSSKDLPSQKVLLTITVVFAVLSAILSLATLWAVILVVGFIIAAVIQSNNMNLDYDYTFTNGTIDFAKVIRKEKRKAICSAEAERIYVLAPAGHAELNRYSSVKTIDCSSHMDNAKDYVLVYRDEAKNEDRKIIFNPSEELLNAIRRFNPRNVYI